MPDPASATPSPSKTQVFLRRLVSTVILWTAILAAMFSGQRLVSDGVFVLLIAFLALAGLLEFYGLAQKRGLACFKISGVIGGVLLMIGTFLNVTGHLGTANGSPARVNDFETGFLILFVLGLCLRQLLAKENPAGLTAIAVTLLGLMYVPWLLNFIQKINFFPQRRRQIFSALFHFADEIQRHGRVCGRLAHWQTQADPAHQPRQNVGRLCRRACRLDRREPGLCAFFRRPHGGHEHLSCRRARRYFEHHGRDRRFDRVAVQARMRRERFRATSCPASAAFWICSTAFCSTRRSCICICGTFSCHSFLATDEHR